MEWTLCILNSGRLVVSNFGVILRPVVLCPATVPTSPRRRRWAGRVCPVLDAVRIVTRPEVDGRQAGGGILGAPPDLVFSVGCPPVLSPVRTSHENKKSRVIIPSALSLALPLKKNEA